MANDPNEAFTQALEAHRASRFEDAEQLYRRVFAGDPRHIGALQNLGLLGLQTNRPQVAAEGYGAALALDERKPDWHCNLALALRALGRLDDAIRHCRRAIELQPDRADPHVTLANILAQLGKPAEAAVSYRQALARNPDLVDARHNLAVALMTQGQFAEALDHFRKALVLNPNLVSAHLNIANAYLAQGRLEEAAAHYERGLAIDEKFPKAQHSLGLVLAKLGRFAEALPRFERAIALKPDFSDAANDLARTLINLGRGNEALGVLARAIAQNETAEMKGLFVQFLRDHRGPVQVQDLPGLLVRALTEPWARAGKVGLVVSPIVRNDPRLRDFIARAANAWPRRVAGPELWGDAGLTAIAGHRLLGALLKSAPVCDIALERFLTNLRLALLDLVLAEPPAAADERLLEFACALAQQCFLNEYVYACTEEEAERARRLFDALAQAVAGGAAITALRLAALACYEHLHTLPDARKLLEGRWPAAVAELLDRQVREPLEERQLASTIPVLTAIEDAVSVAVRTQYEENPFPRWIKCEPPIKPLTLDQFLRGRFPLARAPRPGSAEIDIMVAGCGTGQQAIETAQRYPQARVLAIDLSLGSLAYAKRQTHALGLDQRIEYGHADILKLGALGRTFDLIVSSGVLHHLGDPFAGWRVLLSLLRPGGLMSVGLYSELARIHIKAARTFIAERGYRPVADDIRRCRQELMALPAEAPERKVVRVKDFFSLSECRDLLFHVQEHRLTLPQIAAFVAEQRLAFLGFDLGEREPAKYRARFPADPAMTNLAAWHVFETENPDTFMGMYQFWVQAPTG